jgi:hypothetical protein
MRFSGVELDRMERAQLSAQRRRGLLYIDVATRFAWIDAAPA